MPYIPGEPNAKRNLVIITMLKSGDKATKGPANTKIIVEIKMDFFLPSLSDTAPKIGLPHNIPNMYVAFEIQVKSRAL